MASLPTVVDELLTLPSGPMRVRLHGQGERVAIGVPGLSANCFSFEALGPAVAQAGQRFVALDLRGRGRTPAGQPGTHGWLGHARDVLAVADALEVQRFDYVGHSMGAFIGLALCTLAPERVRRLVLIDALGVPDPRAMPPIFAAAQRLGTVYPSADAFLELVKKAAVVPWGPFWEAHYREDLIEVPGGVRQRAEPRAVLEDLAWAASTDVRSLWSAAGAKTLVVRAAEALTDGGHIITTDDRDAFLARSPRAEAIEVPANHYGVMNHPLTAQAIGEFLT